MEEKKDWPIIGMTLEETAAALRVNPRTVQDMILRGDFPARKVGVGWRISPDAVNRWLENSKRLAVKDIQLAARAIRAACDQGLLKDDEPGQKMVRQAMCVILNSADALNSESPDWKHGINVAEEVDGKTE